MIYYRLLADKYDYFTGYAGFKGELFTTKERSRCVPFIQEHYFEEIFTSSRNTYKSFGVRKVIDEEKVVVKE